MWVETDASCNQYMRKISSKIFEYKQDYILPDGTKEIALATIDLDEYTIAEIESYIYPYGYSLRYWENDLVPAYIIAECIFETDILEFI